MRYEDVPWDAAACKGTDPEAFYPANGLPVKVAARICPTCPILDECASYASCCLLTLFFLLSRLGSMIRTLPSLCLSV